MLTNVSRAQDFLKLKQLQSISCIDSCRSLALTTIYEKMKIQDNGILFILFHS